ncbi:hypothetical protein [Streptomyces sp. NPDC058401]|uniref:hypothetical protein n=1 Tax=Streptomyces sp. NPDC058401 TaxID=3346480 RepID=UPI0036466F2E
MNRSRQVSGYSNLVGLADGAAVPQGDVRAELVWQCDTEVKRDALEEGPPGP